ncbi:MAG TPA: hypothetical protein DCF68_04530 [Cyanothece sp. UBA12306]|nr:hypothetical protein [Cyanothece sp. UBA12306]
MIKLGYLTTLRKRRYILHNALSIILLGVTLFLLQTSVIASPLTKTPLAPPNTSSPQTTLKSFIENIEESYKLLQVAYEEYLQETSPLPSNSVRKQVGKARILFNRAKRCLDLSEVPPNLKEDIGMEGSLMLKDIFDRLELPPYEKIPDRKRVAANKDLRKWTIPNTEIDIVKIEEGKNAGEFLFSAGTVARLREFYEKAQKLPYKPNTNPGFYEFYISTPGRLIPIKWLRNLPSWFQTVYWNQTLWQWIGLVLSLFLVLFICYHNLRWNWRRIATLEPPQRTWETLLPSLMAIASLSGAIYLINEGINITGDVLVVTLIILKTILWILIALTIFLLGNALSESIIASPRINRKSIDASIIRTVTRLLGLTISIAVMIFGIEQVGISLIPILAGLGFGGLALALAARPTLENIIAGLILLIDRPISVGEYCCFGDKEGTIQQIGLRSTRILALNGDLISIPNSQFSELELTNRSRRTSILFRQIIGLRYETTSEQLRFVLAKLREMLLAHPKLLEKGGRVRFVKYGDYSKDVELFAYAKTGNLSEFLGIQEDILLRVQDIVEAAGTDFAFPSQTTYLTKDSGLDQQLSKAVEAEFDTWREKDIFPFPEFSSEQSKQYSKND